MRKVLHLEERSIVEEHLSLMGNDTWPRGTRVLPLPVNSTLQIEEGEPQFRICHVMSQAPPCDHPEMNSGGNAVELEIAFTHPFSLRKRRWICATFTLMACLLFADQNLLAPNVGTGYTIDLGDIQTVVCIIPLCATHNMPRAMPVLRFRTHTDCLTFLLCSCLLQLLSLVSMTSRRTSSWEDISQLPSSQWGLRQHY